MTFFDLFYQTTDSLTNINTSEVHSLSKPKAWLKASLAQVVWNCSRLIAIIHKQFWSWSSLSCEKQSDEKIMDATLRQCSCVNRSFIMMLFYFFIIWRVSQDGWFVLCLFTTAKWMRWTRVLKKTSSTVSWNMKSASFWQGGVLCWCSLFFHQMN